MDLNSMLNSDSGAAAASRPSQPRPPHKSKGPPASPQTPIQPHPHHGFRDYSQPMHASPGQGPPPPPPHDYHHGHAPPTQYVSPTTQHPPANAFGTRPAPPPLQPPGTNGDPRSPGSSMSGPSPYRHTPTSSLSNTSQGYPFPPSQAPNHHNQAPPPPPSPQQRPQYGGPVGYPREPRDSFASPGGHAPPPVGMPTPHGSLSYLPGQQVMPPQTPPVTTPGGGPAGPNHSYSHPPQHQRSQSLQSTSASTPTSAHPHHFGTPYGPQSVSPVATAHSSLPHFDRDQRQTSQPPTPLGPPAIPRQSSTTSNSYPHPPSPYQQRLSSSTAPPRSPFSSHPHPHPPTHQTHQQSLQQQRSPPPPYASSIPQQLQSQPHYDAAHELHRRSQSQASQERDRSISVSPKTRIPSLPGSAIGTAPGPRPPSMAGSDNSDHHHLASQQTSPTASHIMALKREGTPAKRKLEDRDLKPEELDGNNRRPPPPQMNGNHAAPPPSQTSSPIAARRRRVRYTHPPAWALSMKGRQPNASRNYGLKSKNHGAAVNQPPLVNGNTHNHHPPPRPITTVSHEESIQSEQTSRHVSPETQRRPEESAPVVGLDNDAWKLLDGRPFPLEPISFRTPVLDYLSKSVADWLFKHIVYCPFLEEIQSRRVQWEVEAKFGTIIDRRTDERVNWPIRGECFINPDPNCTNAVAFRSSMTLAQHRSYNEWLNHQLRESLGNPQLKQQPPQHVPISYKHRREVDHFYELPSALYQRVPPAMTALAQTRQPLKGRVTTDQETGEVIAKIIKARVADLNIHLPMSQLDCRLSINLEWDWDGTHDEIINGHPPDRDRQPDRSKDRMSYSQGYFQIDLTQVSQAKGKNSQLVKEHELEVEMNADVLIQQAQRAQRPELGQTLYPEYVGCFVNNIRDLASKFRTAEYWEKGD